MPKKKVRRLRGRVSCPRCGSENVKFKETVLTTKLLKYYQEEFHATTDEEIRRNGWAVVEDTSAYDGYRIEYPHRIYRCFNCNLEWDRTQELRERSSGSSLLKEEQWKYLSEGYYWDRETHKKYPRIWYREVKEESDKP